jgi:hypothetical protein
MNKLIIFGLLAFASSLFPGTVDALTISPTKIEIAGDPGQTIIGEIELLNEQDEKKTFYTSFENFEPRGETGAPFFVGSGSGLATWLGTQGSIEITPGERVFIPYSITIPGDATPGGYFAAIFFGSQPPAAGAGSEVSIGGKVGTLVLLRVNGAVAEGGGVLDFSSDVDSRIFTSEPITLSYRFNNTGGDRVTPRGEIKISNAFGMHVATLNANANEGSVLPSSIRRFSTTWGSPIDFSEDRAEPSFFDIVGHQLQNFHLGIYTADLSLSWGESTQVADAAFTFLIIPWQLMVVVIAVVVVLYLLLRQYNRFIISRARSN